MDENAEQSRGERAAKDGEAFYHAILADMPGLICHWQTGGLITYVNNNYCRYFGKSREELVGRTFHPQIPEADRERVAQHLASLSGGERPITAIEHRVILADETIRWQRWMDRRLRATAEGVEEFQSIGHDITAQKDAEEALRQSADLDRILQTVSARFLSPGVGGIEAGIDAALSELGTFAEVDRCYLYQFSADCSHAENTHEWCAPGVATQKPTLQDLVTADFPWMMEQLHRLQPVLVPRVSELPISGVELATLTMGGVRSMMLMPVVAEGSLKGLLGFDMVHTEVDWNRQNLHLLQVAAGLFTNALNQREAKEVLHRLNRILVTLSHANAVMTKATDEEMLLRQLCEILVEDGGFQMVWASHAEPDGGLRTFACAGEHCDAIDAMATRWADIDADCPLLEPVRTGQSQVVNNIPTVADTAVCLTDLLGLGIHAVAALPLFFDDKTTGSINVCSGVSGMFTPATVVHLEDLAGDLTYGLKMLRIKGERDQSHVALQKTLLQTIEAIARITELRDPYTAGHQQRVSQLAVALAAELGLDEDRIEGIRLGALVHDIGKLAVPAEVLTRPGSLTDLEFAMIRLHPQAGYDIMQGVSSSWSLAEMILQHHERMDGSGYPNGLKGEEIILEARIIAVADTVEAMASHRPYRAGLGIESALAEIEQGRGTVYDPVVVDACLRVIREQGFQWEQMVEFG